MPESNHFSEEEIIALLQARDIRGIDILYDQYSNYIFGFIYKIVQSQEVAEIVLQDTYMKVWDKIATYSRVKGKLITWMINIAKNTAVDMTRSKNYKQTLKLISLDHIPATSNTMNMDIKMENIDVRDIVGKLENKYQVIIELLYFKGFTHIEVAKELGIPLGTVKGRVRKAFKDIRIIFER